MSGDERKISRCTCIKPAKYNAAWFCFVYLAQGFVNGYDQVAGQYLKSLGFENDIISVALSVALIPTLLKIPYGIISDKYSFFGLGYRLPYCFIGFVACGLSFFGLGFINPAETFWAYILLTMAATASWTLFDATLDGFVAETVDPANAGYIQGGMNAARGFGMVASAGIFTQMGDGGNWNGVFFLTFGVLMTCALWIPGVRGADKHESFPFSWDAFRLFKTRRVRFLVAFAICGTLPIGIGAFLLPIQLVDDIEEGGFGLKEGETTIFLVLSAIGLLIGAATFGILIDKVREHFLWVFCGMASCVAIGFVFFITAKNLNFMYHTSFMAGFATGGSLLAILVVCMLMCDPAISSSFFAINTTIWNISFAIGKLLGGYLQKNIGYQNAYIFALIVGALAVPMIPGIFYVRYEEEETDKIYDDMNLGSFQMDAQNYDPAKLEYGESGEPLVAHRNSKSSSKTERSKKGSQNELDAQGDDSIENTDEKEVNMEKPPLTDKRPDAQPETHPELQNQKSVSVMSSGAKRQSSTMSSFGFGEKRQSSSRFSMSQFTVSPKKHTSFSFEPNVIGTTEDGKPVRRSIMLTSLARTQGMTAEQKIAYDHQRHRGLSLSRQSHDYSAGSGHSNGRKRGYSHSRDSGASPKNSGLDGPTTVDPNSLPKSLDLPMAKKRIESPRNSHIVPVAIPSTVREESQSATVKDESKTDVTVRGGDEDDDDDVGMEEIAEEEDDTTSSKKEDENSKGNENSEKSEHSKEENDKEPQDV